MDNSAKSIIRDFVGYLNILFWQYWQNHNDFFFNKWDLKFDMEQLAFTFLETIGTLEIGYLQDQFSREYMDFCMKEAVSAWIDSPYAKRYLDL